MTNYTNVSSRGILMRSRWTVWLKRGIVILQTKRLGDKGQGVDHVRIGVIELSTGHSILR
jgi:hypothetical protein